MDSGVLWAQLDAFMFCTCVFTRGAELPKTAGPEALRLAICTSAWVLTGDGAPELLGRVEWG